MAEKKEDQKQEGSKKSVNVGQLLAMVFAVLNMAGIGGAAFFIYKSTLGWESPQITEEQLKEEKEKSDKGSNGATVGPLIYTMDKFTVNLLGEPKRIIRVEVNLEMLNKDGFEEIINSDNRAKSRDLLVRVLNEKTFGELESIQGKLFLKDSIAKEINSILDKGIVKDVYFSEFVVQ